MQSIIDQSRDTGNLGYTRQRTMTKKTKQNTTQKTKMMTPSKTRLRAT